MKKLTTPQTSSKCPGKDEIMRSVKAAIKAHKEVFLEEFKNHDYCNAGIVRKEVFSKLIDKYVFRLTQEQVSIFFCFTMKKSGTLCLPTVLITLTGHPEANINNILIITLQEH